PPIVQSPRGDQRTAAVAATARQHVDAPALRGAVEKADPRKMREIAPGILHHLNQLDLEVLDHRAVDFHHLRPRDVRRFEWKFFDVHDVSTHQRSRCSRCWATRSAFAMIVNAGFTAPLETKKLPSTT